MTKRLIAIALIFGATALAWMILGSSVFSRTYQTDGRLKEGVTGLWGGEQIQVAPNAIFTEMQTQRVESEDKKGNRKIELIEKEVQYAVPLESSKIKTEFDLAHRQKVCCGMPPIK